MKKKINYLERFAEKLGCKLQLKGEIGFGRECIGFTKNGNYLGYDLKGGYGEGMDKKMRLYPPGGVEAYHKGNYLAVLGRGEVAIDELFKWIRKIDIYNLEIRGFYPPMPTLGTLMGKPFEPELIIIKSK